MRILAPGGGQVVADAQADHVGAARAPSHRDRALLDEQNARHSGCRRERSPRDRGWPSVVSRLHRASRPRNRRAGRRPRRRRSAFAGNATVAVGSFSSRPSQTARLLGGEAARRGHVLAGADAIGRHRERRTGEDDHRQLAAKFRLHPLPAARECANTIPAAARRSSAIHVGERPDRADRAPGRRPASTRTAGPSRRAAS